MDFDANDRRLALTDDVNGSYYYDDHERRIKSNTEHDDGTITTRFNVYDAGGSLVYVVNLAPGTNDDHITNYIKLDGQTIARVKSTGPRQSYTDTITWLHHDHLGSAVAGTDANGDIEWTEKYTPYGISLINDISNDNQAGFTGHIKDTDTGLTYMQARYYDPVVSRFLSHDPVGFSVERPLMFNRYVYTEGNPVNAIDPDGLQCSVSRIGAESGSICGGGMARFDSEQYHEAGRGKTDPSVKGAETSEQRQATAQQAFDLANTVYDIPNDANIRYQDDYASIGYVLGRGTVFITEKKGDTLNGTAAPIDGVRQGKNVTIFRSAVEPTSPEGRFIREPDGNMVNNIFSTDTLSAIENAVYVVGHEVGGHMLGGHDATELGEARSDQEGEKLLKRFRE